ncbi:hypothetical protein NC653_007218 [Populus alba x Populus x berolinensis]|uniref:Uncharacterized protein n=1 Tax=Populus alba x Populus x berolinensis TaxID=444605 RepID=A0AAD6WD87_9ROSI|nr:hypothetical protein NC653_007218 [Populus alba x Populus x berolinensis]
MNWKVIDTVKGGNNVPVMERSGNHLNTSNVKCFIRSERLGEVTELQTSVFAMMERQRIAVTLLLLHERSYCIDYRDQLFAPESPMQRR